MDSQRAIQLLQAHIDAGDMPLFSQAAAMGIRALERVALLEAELATANLQADQYLRAMVEIGHKLSIENAEQFHTAAYAQGRIIDAIIERRVEAEAQLKEARNKIVSLEDALITAESMAFRAGSALSHPLIDEGCRLRTMDECLKIQNVCQAALLALELAKEEEL